MDKILNNWNNFLNEQTEPFQKKVKQGYVKDRNQYLKGGKGKPSKPFDVEPSSTRAKSAPPIGESSIEEVWTNIDPELLEINDNNLDETIVKKGSQYCLKSKKSGKNLGCYANKAGAKKREKQVQYFKHMKESYEIDEGVIDSLKNAASNTHSAIKDLGRHAKKVVGTAALGTALAYGGSHTKAASDKIDTARSIQQTQNIENSRPSTEQQKIRDDLNTAIYKDVNDFSSKQGKNQLLQNLIKVFKIDENIALQILNLTSHNHPGGTMGPEGTTNLSNFINVTALAKYDLKANKQDDSNLAALKKAVALWEDPAQVKQLAQKHNINLTPNSEGPVVFDAANMPNYGVKESKKIVTKENAWTSIDSELLAFELIEQAYQIDENLWKDLKDKLTMSKQQEKKKEYTNYNEVYNNIYVGAAPIKGGKLIHSLLEQQEFIKIFIMSNESANIIKRQYKDERNIPSQIVLDYAIEDTENPTQEEIQKLNKAGLLIKGYARQGKVLVTCNKGLNRSATAACIAMTLFGIEPEEAIRKVQSARGQQALTLNNKPHQGFMPIILGSKET